MIDLERTLRQLPALDLDEANAQAHLARAKHRLRTPPPATRWERHEPTLLSALAVMQLLWVIARLLPA